MKPPWLIRAIGEMNVEEFAGAEANPRILEYFSSTSFHASDDLVPWCSAFVSWCLEQAGVKSTRSAAARSYLNWGESIQKGIQGAIVILSRGNDLTKGHVGFWWSEDLTQVYLLSGNQRNKVCVQGFPKKDIIGIRAPPDEYWIGGHNEDDTLN